MAKDFDELKYKMMYQVLPILREYAEDGIININGNVEIKNDVIIFKHLIEYLEGKKELTEELMETGVKTVYEAIVKGLKEYDPEKNSQSEDTYEQ
jgi:hypothetical protein